MWKTIRSKERFFRVSVDNCFRRMNDADEVFVRMKEKQLHGEELTKEDLKRVVKEEAYRKKLQEELNSQGRLRYHKIFQW